MFLTQSLHTSYVEYEGTRKSLYSKWYLNEQKPIRTSRGKEDPAEPARDIAAFMRTELQQSSQADIPAC